MHGLVTPGPKTPAPQPHSHTTPGAGAGPLPLPLTHEPPEPAPTVGRNWPRDRPECRLRWRTRLLLQDSGPRPATEGSPAWPTGRGTGPAPGAPRPTLFTCPQWFSCLEKKDITAEPKAGTRSETPTRCRPACVFAPRPLQMALARSRDRPSTALTPCRGPAQGGAGLKCSPRPAPRGPPGFMRAAGRLRARLKRRETCIPRGFRVNGAGGDFGRLA